MFKAPYDYNIGQGVKQGEIVLLEIVDSCLPTHSRFNEVNPVD